MPQSVPQRNQKPIPAPQRPPQPAVELAPAETEDQVYGLVSVLYHALQGAQACDQYVDDAERAGDEELSQFFKDWRDQQNDRANLAKRLLAARVEDDTDEEDEDEGDED